MLEQSIEKTKTNEGQTAIVNFNELQTAFLENLKFQGKSINTLKNYKTDLDCFKYYLNENVSTLNMDQFGLDETLEYGKYLQKRYNSDNSRRRRVQALRMFFDYLLSKGIVPSNPVRKIPSSPKFLDIPRPISFVDLKTLWNYLLKEELSQNEMNSLFAQRNQVVFLLIYCAGLKVSDLSNLKEEHIVTGTNPRVLIIPKKRDPYSVALPPIFNEIYSNYKGNLEKQKVKSNIEFNDVLFNANPYRILSGSLSPRGLEIIFEDFRKKLLISVTPKTLRQACIFKWLFEKHPDGLIKEWMGVAPSYSLKLYKDHSHSYPYNDLFIAELRRHFQMHN